MRRRYLITYDVSDDKRRTGVFKTLMARGDHVQFSVFLCELSDREKAELRDQLRGHVHPRTDQVLVIDLGTAERALEIGKDLECIGQSYVPASRVLVV